MKETYYFMHDYHARTDGKITKLLKTHGWEGYGIYWAIVEKLYESSGEIDSDIDLLTYDLRSDKAKVGSIISDFDLFYIKEGGGISSHSVSRRIDERTALRQARSEAGSRGGYSKSLAKVEVCYSKNIAEPSRKGKERKGKEKKENEITDTEAPAKAVAETPIQTIVRAYKFMKGVSPDDKSWDKDNFPRHAKAAKLLLNRKETVEAAISYMEMRSRHLESEGLSWKLETIANNAATNEGMRNPQLNNGESAEATKRFLDDQEIF